MICEKPLFFKVEQGEEIKALAEKMNKIVALHTDFQEASFSFRCARWYRTEIWEISTW